MSSRIRASLTSRFSSLSSLRSTSTRRFSSRLTEVEVISSPEVQEEERGESAAAVISGRVVDASASAQENLCGRDNNNMEEDIAYAHMPPHQHDGEVEVEVEAGEAGEIYGGVSAFECPRSNMSVSHAQ